MRPDRLRSRAIKADWRKVGVSMEAGSDSSATVPAAIVALERELFTQPVRYSRPGLLSHITYLYSMTVGADQPISRDAAQRYTELRTRLDALRTRIRSLE